MSIVFLLEYPNKCWTIRVQRGWFWIWVELQNKVWNMANESAISGTSVTSLLSVLGDGF